MNYLTSFFTKVVLFTASLFLLCFCENNKKVDSASVLPSTNENRNSDNKAQSSETASDLPIEKIQLPKGFTISVFASGITEARSLARGSQGTIFVGNRRRKKVYAVEDKNKDYKADKVYVIDDNLSMPCGVAFRNGDLYVAEVNRILKYKNIESQLNSPPEPVVITEAYPSDKWHGWKFIRFGPDGKLYVPVGAPCNVCERDEDIYSTITRMNPDGTGLEIFAYGVRNSVGFDWHPKTKELWFTDNGRDMLGDDIPGDELNRVQKAGQHFGFPYCHQGNVSDPEFGSKRKCEEFTQPAQVLGAHVAALGMRFYNHTKFPKKYHNQIFIAEHGSWNRSSKVGYRLVSILLEGNKVVSYAPFATGWLEGEKAWGRPVDVMVLPDGSLLVSDDYADAIYRIDYKG